MKYFLILNFIYNSQLFAWLQSLYSYLVRKILINFGYWFNKIIYTANYKLFNSIHLNPKNVNYLKTFNSRKCHFLLNSPMYPRNHWHSTSQLIPEVVFDPSSHSVLKQKTIKLAKILRHAKKVYNFNIHTLRWRFAVHFYDGIWRAKRFLKTHVSDGMTRRHVPQRQWFSFIDIYRGRQLWDYKEGHSITSVRVLARSAGREG